MSIARANAIIAMTPGADHTDYEGYFVELTAGNPTVCNAVTDVPFGIIIVGDVVAGKDSIGVCGGNLPTVRAKLNGPVSKGNTLQLHSDGSVVVDAGTGARRLSR